MGTTPAPPSDPTFRSYSKQQAAAYAAGRGSYASALYDFVLEHHQQTGGSMGLLLDVGCGPGNATRDLASCFTAAVGVDPGDAMIAKATELGGKTDSGEDVKFFVSAAEEIDEPDGLAPGTIDLITCAMSAHWFNMAQFWPAAAKLLRPGGTIALWTHASLYCHPSTPNAKEVQRILSHLEDVTLAPYVLEPNRLSRGLYSTLPLPWDVGETSLDSETFLRREWDVSGVLSDGQEFFGGTLEDTLAEVGRALGTASMVTRWRDAHFDMAETDQDCVTLAMEQVREAMGATRGEEGHAKLRNGNATAILLVKKIT